MTRCSAMLKGGRDRIYTLMYSSNYLASAIGPLLAALLFWLRGNSWSLHTLGTVVLIGMAVAVIPICTVFMFNDDNSLDSEASPITDALLPEKDVGACLLHLPFTSLPCIPHQHTIEAHPGLCTAWRESLTPATLRTWL